MCPPVAICELLCGYWLSRTKCPTVKVTNGVSTEWVVVMPDSQSVVLLEVHAENDVVAIYVKIGACVLGRN